MVLYEFPSNNEVNLISRENGIDKDKYKRATFQPYSFLYIDKPEKIFKNNFNEIIPKVSQSGALAQ